MGYEKIFAPFTAVGLVLWLSSSLITFTQWSPYCFQCNLKCMQCAETIGAYPTQFNLEPWAIGVAVTSITLLVTGLLTICIDKFRDKLCIWLTISVLLVSSVGIPFAHFILVVQNTTELTLNIDPDICPTCSYWHSDNPCMLSKSCLTGTPFGLALSAVMIACTLPILHIIILCLEAGCRYLQRYGGGSGSGNDDDGSHVAFIGVIT